MAAGSDGKEGLKTALGELAAGAAPTLPESPQQLALLSLPAAPGDIEAGGANNPDASRGAGRPPGARNKRTQEWIDFVLTHVTKGVSPMQFLAELMVMPIADVQKQFGGDKEKAGDRKVFAAANLMPFFHQKLPLAIDITNHRVVSLTIVEASSADGSSAGNPDEIDITARVVKVEDFQGVTEADSEDVER